MKTPRHSILSRIRLLCTGSVALLLVASAIGCGDGGHIQVSFQPMPPRDAQVLDAPGLLDADADAEPDPPPPLFMPEDPVCRVGACDFDRGGCASDEQCSAEMGATVCVSNEASADDGERCERSGECAAGLICIAERGTGRCRIPCCARGESACGAERQCALQRREPTGAEIGWGVCLPIRSCDPLFDEDVCESWESCYIRGLEGSTDCAPTGEQRVGESCELAEDCERGATCTGIARKVCTRVCMVGAGACPAEEGRCKEFAFTPVGVGLCTP